MGLGQSAPPSWEGARLGFAPVPLQLHQPEEQVTQAGHDENPTAATDAGIVFAQNLWRQTALGILTANSFPGKQRNRY